MLISVIKLWQFQAIRTSRPLHFQHILLAQQVTNTAQSQEEWNWSPLLNRRSGKNAVAILTTCHTKEALSMWKIHFLERILVMAKIIVFPVTVWIECNCNSELHIISFWETNLQKPPVDVQTHYIKTKNGRANIDQRWMGQYIMFKKLIIHV